MEGVVGTSFNDTIPGATGNDILRGGDGNDTLNGAGGIDLIDFRDGTSGLTFTSLKARSERYSMRPQRALARIPTATWKASSEQISPTH